MSETRKRQCRKIAERALRQATAAHNPDAKRNYVKLAALCHELAEHIDRAADPGAFARDGARPRDTKQ